MSRANKEPVFETTLPNVEAGNKRSKWPILLASATLALTLTSCSAGTSASEGSSPEATSSISAMDPSETAPAVVNQTEALQARIDQRPEKGSVEYVKLFESLNVPYVEGQSPEEVVAEFEKMYIAAAQIEASDVAPMTFDDVTQWAIENKTASTTDTANGLVGALQTDYYDVGVANALYGYNAVRSEFAKNTLPRIQATFATNIAGAMERNTTVDPEAYHMITPGIVSGIGGPKDIYANPIGYTDNVGGTEANPNVTASLHLRAEESSPGVIRWYMVNNANDSNG